MTSHPANAAIDLHASVAGEEDPGASVDLALDTPSSARSDQPVGTPGTGETVCPKCGGSGKLGGRDCPECEGTGKINVGIGGA
jgi:RecJ-like exonuclease